MARGQNKQSTPTQGAPNLREEAAALLLGESQADPEPTMDTRRAGVETPRGC